MRLETERLLIEPLTYQDLDALATVEADSLVRRYIDSKTMTRHKVADYIDAMLRSYEEKDMAFCCQSKGRWRADRSMRFHK